MRYTFSYGSRFQNIRVSGVRPGRHGIDETYTVFILASTGARGVFYLKVVINLGDEPSLHVEHIGWLGHPYRGNITRRLLSSSLFALEPMGMRGAWVHFAGANETQRVLAFTNSLGPVPAEYFRQIHTLRKCPVSKAYEGIRIWEFEVPSKQKPLCLCENTKWFLR